MNPLYKERTDKARITRVKKTGSLADHFPEIAKEVHPRSHLQANEITYGSKTKILWLCSLCKNVWETSPNIRTKDGCGCPKCSKSKKIARLKKTNLLNPNKVRLIELSYAHECNYVYSFSEN